MNVTRPARADRGHRIDPDALPARFRLRFDAGAGEANVYLDRTGVVVKRRLSGLPLTLSLPHSAYDGIAVRLDCGDEGPLTASVELAHRDPALSVPLSTGRTVEEAADDWRRWCDVLRLPMLLVEADGRMMRIGHAVGVPIGAPQPRRRSALATRHRPRFLVRRRPGRPGPHEVLAGWREIIARD